MAESGPVRKEDLYAQLAQSLQTLSANLQHLKGNLHTTQSQVADIQRLSLAHASLFISANHAIHDEPDHNLSDTV
ncbi:hypothetical protein H4R35_002124 [Dimargaris xerosporica]|nr:hypothetical protein H4R35_002124 [Dimargaris xerosporica]